MKPPPSIVLPLLLTLWLGPALAQERPAEKAFKGIDLYSWRDDKGDWVFALVPGTNRLKLEAEIKTGDLISGVAELERRFFQYAEGEQVFWSHLVWPPGAKVFEYPDAETMADVESAAKKAEVKLHVPPADERGD